MKCLSFNPASAAINGAQSIRLTETVSGTSWEHSSSFIIYQRLSVLQPCIRLNSGNKRNINNYNRQEHFKGQGQPYSRSDCTETRVATFALFLLHDISWSSIQISKDVDQLIALNLELMKFHNATGWYNSCVKCRSGEVPLRSRSGIPNLNCRPDKAANRVWLLIHLSPGLLYYRPLRGLDSMWMGNIIILYFIFLTNKPSRTVTDGRPSHSAKQEQLYSLILSRCSMLSCYLM